MGNFFAGNPAKKGYEVMRGEAKPVQNFPTKKVLVIGLYRVAVGAAGRALALHGKQCCPQGIIFV